MAKTQLVQSKTKETAAQTSYPAKMFVEHFHKNKKVYNAALRDMDQFSVANSDIARLDTAYSQAPSKASDASSYQRMPRQKKQSAVTRGGDLPVGIGMEDISQRPMTYEQIAEAMKRPSTAKVASKKQIQFPTSLVKDKTSNIRNISEMAQYYPGSQAMSPKKLDEPRISKENRQSQKLINQPLMSNVQSITPKQHQQQQQQQYYNQKQPMKGALKSKSQAKFQRQTDYDQMSQISVVPSSCQVSQMSRNNGQQKYASQKKLTSATMDPVALKRELKNERYVQKSQKNNTKR